MSMRDSVRRYGEEASEAIAEHQEITIASNIAKRALERDNGQRHLIGFTGRGATEITYCSTLRSVKQRRYDVDDIQSPPRSRLIQDAKNRHRVEQLLRDGELVADWIWIHPRWRWVIE